MGVTLCNLHLPQSVFREEIVDPGYTIRRSASGWVSLLPELPEGQDIDKPYNQLVKLAKQGSGPALLFLYVDGDAFTLFLYADEKKAGGAGQPGKNHRQSLVWKGSAG